MNDTRQGCWGSLFYFGGWSRLLRAPRNSRLDMKMTRLDKFLVGDRVTWIFGGGGVSFSWDVCSGGGVGTAPAHSIGRRPRGWENPPDVYYTSICCGFFRTEFCFSGRGEYSARFGNNCHNYRGTLNIESRGPSDQLSALLGGSYSRLLPRHCLDLISL